MLYLWLLACNPDGEQNTKTEQTEKIEQVAEKKQRSPRNKSASNKVPLVLDGKEIQVHWDDGDTFDFIGEDGKKVKARLKGLNSLESYGPVHQWGDWTEVELYHLAKAAGPFAASQKWHCTDTGKGGGYGRLLVDCPDFRKAILEAGLAHPFSVGEKAPESDLAAMKVAIDSKKGIWEKGVPDYLVTSLHSNAEKADKDGYNRVCDVKTGQCEGETHTDNYETCQKVCLHDSCMTYVPYQFRYGKKKSECLQITK